MKTSTRPPRIGEAGEHYADIRGHVKQTSTSDSNHHITEAIGDLYGGDDHSKGDTQLQSLESLTGNKSGENGEVTLDPRGVSWTRSIINDDVNTSTFRSSITMSSTTRKSSHEANLRSSSISLREDPSKSQFPLNDIDCESDPADVAQALSNLQALRRMSMDVGNTSDPDLPSFQGASLIPSVAPTSNDKDDDPSRLFWVPARVHPELAPMEFKTFLENRIYSIKRHSGEHLQSSSDAYDRSGSPSSALQRRKSMLSTQIDDHVNRSMLDTDGSAQSAEENSILSDFKMVDLKELDTLVRDSSKVMRKLTLVTTNNKSGENSLGELEDIPILPQAPGTGLRRSTRTTYRRGSLRKGERVPLSKRAGNLRRDTDGEESISPVEKKQPVSPESSTNEKFIHPSRGALRRYDPSQIIPSQSVSKTSRDEILTLKESQDSSVAANLTGATASRPETIPRHGSPTQISRPEAPLRNATFPSEGISIPKIVETPPSGPQADQAPPAQIRPLQEIKSAETQPVQITKATPDPPIRSSKRSVSPNSQSAQAKVAPQQSSSEITPSTPLLLESNARTDALTFIPTVEVKKHEKKIRKEKDDTENSTSKKATWNWFKGSDEKDKKERKKDDDKEWKKTKKTSTEKPHDSARLDVLQSTLETGISRAREGILYDRDTLDPKNLDDKKKDNRKFSSEKKEKDSIFSSIFGVNKKKTDRDTSGKKGSSLRTLSPDPPVRLLKPDVDYNWTRFSILEERAIYRMAHIKLANPRRALYSQVLLSNFMYSYLAKVQQMHPHMQIPQSALQKKQELERRQKEQEQQALQLIQESEQYSYDYHQGIAKYAEGASLNEKSERVNYVDDSQIYDYDHQNNNSTHEQSTNRPQSRASQHNSENGYVDKDQYRRHGNDYFSHGNQMNDKDDEMW